MQLLPLIRRPESRADHAPDGGRNSSPKYFANFITHRKDAVYPATIVGIPPMEDFYIGGASVKLFLPIFKMNFPEIVDIALPAEGVFHNLVFVSIKKTYPMQAYKIMHGLWGMSRATVGRSTSRPRGCGR